MCDWEARIRIEGSYAQWKHGQKCDCFPHCSSQEAIFCESIFHGLSDLNSTPCLRGLWAQFGCGVHGFGWDFDLCIAVLGAPAAPQASRRSGRECSGILWFLPHGSVWSKRAQPVCSDPFFFLSTCSSTSSSRHSTSTTTAYVVHVSPHHPHHPTQPSPVMRSQLGRRGVFADRSAATFKTLQCESDPGDPVWTLCSLTDCCFQVQAQLTLFQLFKVVWMF